MSKTFSADAEGMPKVSRRAALASLASIPAVALPAVAASAAEPAHPWDRARTLAKQLSEVLAENTAAGPSGKCYAEIYPAGSSEYTVMFGDIGSREYARHNVTLPCQDVIDRHKQARSAFEAAIAGVDLPSGQKPTKAAKRLYDRTNAAEEAAMIAVCAFHPAGRADAAAKAAYLEKFIRFGEFQQEHLLELVNAGVSL